MGLCDSMRWWRWQRGSSRVFMAGVGALLLGLSLAQSVPPQAACRAVAVQQNLTEYEYQNTTEEVDSGFMSAFVQSFLNTVQPNPFPKDLIVEVVQDLNEVLERDLVKEALVYQVGFLVCAAIGILYIVLMPIVGLFLACCRCCGNCGGRMYQKQSSSIHCRRRTLYWSAFITTIIILAGNICMFKSNEALKKTVDQTAEGLSTTFENIKTFLEGVPEELNHVVNESYNTIQEVTRNLETIGPQLGAEIQQEFREILEPALNSVRLLDEDTENTSNQLNNLNSSLTELQSSVDRIQSNVTAVRNDINQTLSKPDCVGCDQLQPELQKLDALDTTISIPNLKGLESAMDEVRKINLSTRAKEAEDFFNSIPQRVTNDTKGIVENSKQLLDNIEAQIAKLANDTIPVSTLNNISDTLVGVHRDIKKLVPELERGEHIRWGVCVALCCLVLLVVVCNLLGLVFGPLGLKPKVDPTKRSTTADCGGIFLMMSAGFSFLFSWLFMILVLVLFLLGGNIYTLVCRPWNNGQLLQLLDTPGLIPGLNFSQSLGLKSQISISEIYKSCDQNKPLWTTLHLNELVDLDDLLNVTKYTNQIQDYFDDADIILSTITLLSPESKDQLSSFSSKANDFDPIDFTSEINNVSSINLNTTADKLDQLAGLQSNDKIKNELQDQARDLRQIQADLETTIIPQMKNVNTAGADLQSSAKKINGSVGEVLSKVGAAQDFLNTNTTQIVKTESQKFVDCQMGYFVVYANWANNTITLHLGRCGPVADVVDFAESFLCLNLVESLNAFWFSLGWCLIFFVPSIIFSIKLAKYYRRMKYSDVFEEDLNMCHIPRAHIKSS